MCVPAASWSFARRSVDTVRSGLSSTSQEAPRPVNVRELGGFVTIAYVLNKPSDCRHVSQPEAQTRHRHMSLTCWTALSTPHPPPLTHTHTHLPPRCSWSTTHFCSTPPLGPSPVYHHAPTLEATVFVESRTVYKDKQWSNSSAVNGSEANPKSKK